jgi:hypothetical protein
MRDKEIIGLYEAYQQVHSQVEEVEQLDELSLDTLRSARKERFKKVDEIESSGKEDPKGRKKLRRTQKAIAKKTAPGQPDYPHKGASARLNMEMEYDAFDIILEHLVAEGYADTNEAALVIMANMSEEWRESIVEGEEKKEEPQKPFTGEGPKKPKGWRPTGPKLKSGQRPGYAR